MGLGANLEHLPTPCDVCCLAFGLVAQRLEDKLDDDYLLWYDVPIGPKNVPPDFVVMHPRRDQPAHARPRALNHVPRGARAVHVRPASLFDDADLQSMMVARV